MQPNQAHIVLDSSLDEEPQNEPIISAETNGEGEQSDYGKVKHSSEIDVTTSGADDRILKKQID